MTQGIVTLLLMVLFIGFCLWVYRPSAKAKYQAAAKMPIEIPEVLKRKDHQS